MTYFQFHKTPGTRQSFFLLAFTFLVPAGAADKAIAQQDDPVVRSETSLVQLNVGVVDRQGRPITTLLQSDFVVYEDGVRQTIEHFEPTETPFSLVMLLDVSGSTSTFRQQLIFAATRFLDALSPGDRVSVIAFNAKIKTLIGFTNNRSKIDFAIGLAAQGAGETHFYEALRFALKELDKEGPQRDKEGPRRRKAIVALTDGLDTEMRNSDRALVRDAQSDQEAIAAIKPDNKTLAGVLNEAARQGVTIYPLALPSGDPKRLPLPDPTITGIYTAARTRLQSLADRSGGRAERNTAARAVGRTLPRGCG